MLWGVIGIGKVFEDPLWAAIPQYLWINLRTISQDPLNIADLKQ